MENEYKNIMIHELENENPDTLCAIRTVSGYFVNTKVSEITKNIVYANGQYIVAWPIHVMSSEGSMDVITPESIDILLIYRKKCQGKGTRIQSKG